MKRSLIRGISKNVQNQKLANKLIKEADRYTKIKILLKELSMEPPIDAECVFKIRNKIIHGGYPSSKEDALTSLKIAREMIAHYNVPLFEN